MQGLGSRGSLRRKIINGGTTFREIGSDPPRSKLLSRGIREEVRKNAGSFLSLHNRRRVVGKPGCQIRVVEVVDLLDPQSKRDSNRRPLFGQRLRIRARRPRHSRGTESNAITEMKNCFPEFCNHL